MHEQTDSERSGHENIKLGYGGILPFRGMGTVIMQIIIPIMRRVEPWAGNLTI